MVWGGKLLGSEVVAGVVAQLQALEAHNKRLVVGSFLESDELVLLDIGCGLGGGLVCDLVAGEVPFSLAGPCEDELFAAGILGDLVIAHP